MDLLSLVKSSSFSTDYYVSGTADSKGFR